MAGQRGRVQRRLPVRLRQPPQHGQQQHQAVRRIQLRQRVPVAQLGDRGGGGGGVGRHGGSRQQPQRRHQRRQQLLSAVRVLARQPTQRRHAVQSLLPQLRRQPVGDDTKLRDQLRLGVSPRRQPSSCGPGAAVGCHRTLLTAGEGGSGVTSCRGGHV